VAHFYTSCDENLKHFSWIWGGIRPDSIYMSLGWGRYLSFDDIEKIQGDMTRVLLLYVY